MKKNNDQAEFARKMRKNTVTYPDLIKRNYKSVTIRFSVLYTD